MTIYNYADYKLYFRYKQRFEDFIKVSTQGPAKVSCEWRIPEKVKNYLGISPVKFELLPGEEVEARLSIIAYDYKQIHDSIE